MVDESSGQRGPATDDPDRWITFANGLTAIRLLLIPVVVVAIVRDRTVVAFVVFWLAVVTDLVDGRVARRRGEASRLGGVLDHTTDALFVASGLAACAWRGVIPAALPPLVLLAFAQYALDSRVLAGQRLRTSLLGRWNGIAYYVILGVPVVRDALDLGWPPAWLLGALAWALVVSTGLSMLDRAQARLAMRRAHDSPDAGR
jgi:cardiolipin synthase